MEKMARRIPLALVTVFFRLAALASTASAQNTPSVLVQYSFDDNSLESGPDTFAVFQKAKGSVRLSTENRFSGYRSIEIRDVAGDKDFPELQGYFQLRTHGKVFAHFALMTTNPADEFNIALAGPEWFALRNNGIGFWLKTIDGYLCHTSDSIPKKLFAIRPFVWYVVNVAYDIDAGTYDLLINEEGQESPVVSLQHEANATRQPGSAVDKFSFIGDTGVDESNVVYYVDDVIVGVEESVTQLPFVAPGRRKLFVDYWNEYQRDLRSRPAPLPFIEFSDLGIRAEDIQSLKTAGLWELLQRIMTSRAVVDIPAGISPEHQRLLQAVTAWRAGNSALTGEQPGIALAHFQDAARLLPGGKINAMNAVLALAALGRWEQVDIHLARIFSDWRDDIRFPVAAAMIGIARQDLARAEEWLRNPAEFAGQPAHQLVADQYFYVLLWQNQIARAEQFAQRMADRDRTTRSSIWTERLGDAAFMSGDFGTALRLYEETLSAGDGHTEARVLLKLSDVYFRLGDLDKERHYRELLYGHLER
jgi:hypothetical protein